MAAQLRPVPDTPRRVLGVIRVSKERDGMSSPEIQRTIITEYCAARGYALAGFVEGIDDSGSQRRSGWWRKLDESVERVESGEVDGIVVWKFSRTARHRLRWAVALDRVETASGVLESATEQFDTATSAGRFARGMVAEMNAFEAERIGEVWQESHQRRVRMGRPHSGKPRWGYVYDRGEKLHKPHPEQGPVLADLYRRYVTGETIGRLVRWLNAHGWRTTAGKPWTDNRLRLLLDGGFAAGLFRYHGELHPGAHDALIDDRTWQAYTDARLSRRRIPARREGSPYLLSGLVRCMRCGSIMVAYRRRPQGSQPERLSWRCGRCPERGTGPSGYVASWKVEEQVLAFVRELAEPVNDATEGKIVHDARSALLDAEVARLSREASKLREALVRLAVSNAESPLPASVYQESKSSLEARAAEVEAALELAGSQSRRATTRPREAAADLLDQWDELPIPSRREVLRTLLDCILVRTGSDTAFRVVEWRKARGH